MKPIKSSVQTNTFWQKFSSLVCQRDNHKKNRQFVHAYLQKLKRHAHVTFHFFGISFCETHSWASLSPFSKGSHKKWHLHVRFGRNPK